MHCTLLLIGKTRNAALTALENDYCERIRRYLPFEVTVLPRSKSRDAEDSRDEEGRAIMKQLRNDDYVVLLDERGKQYTSPAFASWLDKHAVGGKRNIVFVVGGAYGFSQEVYARSNEMLALSKMTFAHEMVRSIFEEQLYRACTIIRGEGYHH